MPPTPRPRMLRDLATCSLLILLAAAPAFAAPIQFRTANTYITGQFQTAIRSGDFDGDLDPDLAEIRQAGAIQWWSNAGGVLSGPFPVTTPFPIRDDLAAGDLNGDGRADLVGCDDAAPGGAVAILFATGAGFAPASLVPTDSAGVASATLADLDGDGDLDLVASNRRTRKVHRLFNDGAGNFSGLASTPIVGDVSRTWVAELTGDSNPDILVGHWPHLLLSAGPGSPFNSFGGFRSRSWTLAGTGGGGFAAPSASGVRGIVALGRFGGPGSMDAYVYDSLGIGIAPGNGDGTFGPSVFTPGNDPSCAQVWASPIDLDADATDEIVVMNGCGEAAYHVFRINASHQLVHRQTYETGFHRTPWSRT